MKAMFFYLAGQPDFPRRHQQRMRTYQVGLDKRIGAGNGAVHVALGGEVHEGVHVALLQGFQNTVVVTDVRMNKGEISVVLQRLEISAVARVGQLIKRHHLVLGVLAHPVVNKVF